MTDHTARQELEDFVRARAEAVERQDADALAAAVDHDVVDYGVLPPTAQRGDDSTREGVETWFGFYSDGPHYEPHLVRADAEGGLGYVTFFYRVTGTTVGGDPMDMWVRSTQVLRRADDGWKVVHSHESVPFDVESGKALISEPLPEGIAT